MEPVVSNFIEIVGALIVFAIPTIFLVIAIGPFVYLWKKKKMTVYSSILTIIAVIAVEVLYVFGVQQGIIWIAGQAACDLYGC